MDERTAEVLVPASTAGLVIMQHGEAGAIAMNFVTIDGAVPLPRRQTAGALRRLADEIERDAVEFEENAGAEGANR